MQIFYKNTQNQIYAFDENDDPRYIPLDCVRITLAEKDAIINTPDKIKADTNKPVLAQIAVLEASVTARVWREYITKPNTAVKNGKTPAQFIADIDSQIAVLRASLV